LTLPICVAVSGGEIANDAVAELRAERDALQAKLDEVVGKRVLTDKLVELLWREIDRLKAENGELKSRLEACQDGHG
jgi:hypothetical protein